MRAGLVAVIAVLLVPGCLGFGPRAPEAPAGTVQTPSSTGPITGSWSHPQPTSTAPVNPNATGGKTANSTPLAVEPATFATAVDLGEAASAEPALTVTPGGTILVETPPSLWRSTDGGKTFSALGQPAGPIAACFFVISPPCEPLPVANPYHNTVDRNLSGTGDGSLQALPDGHIAWAGLFGSNQSVPFQISSDSGQSWTQPFDVGHGNNTDREWVAYRGSTVAVSWRDFGTPNTRLSSSLPPPAVMDRVTHDEGKTWTRPIRIDADGLAGPISMDPISNWSYLARFDYNAGNIVVDRSTDLATWSNVTAAKGVGSSSFIFPVTAVDTAGVVYLVFSAEQSTPPGPEDDPHIDIPGIFLSTSSDHGITWSRPTLLSPAGVPAIFPWIIAGSAGRAAIAWYEGAEPVPLAAPNEWHVAVALTTTGDAAQPKFVESAASATIHVGNICTAGTGCLFPVDDRSMLDFFQIAALPSGKIAVAYAADPTDSTHTRQMVEVFANVMSGGTPLW
ncbi:MAG: hypothetical protein ACYDDF_14845 [Thermoplasmatota archaeon]